MSITVGFNEGVVVSGASVNEKDSLVIELSQGNTSLDLFEAMNSGASMDTATTKIMLFPVDNKWYGKDATHQEMVMKFRQLTTKLGEIIKHQVEKVTWNMFEGTGINSASDIAEKITSETVAAQIGKNIYTQFVAMVAASDKTKTQRLKLVRQSAAKHFPTLAEVLYFKKDGGEWTVAASESMDIPAAQSKLKFTTKEIEKGLDKADKVVADTPSVSDNDLPF